MCNKFIGGFHMKQEKNILERFGYHYLSPDVRIIEKVGSTGSGKTMTDLLFTTPKALNVLIKAVGEGSATLGDQTKVFTEKLTDHIIVAAKLGDEIYTWEQLIELILKVFTKIVKGNYKDSQIEDLDQIQKGLIKELIEALDSKRNTEAQPRLLKEYLRREFVNEIADYSMPFLSENLQIIYQEAKNSLLDMEAKPKSRKFDEAISQRLQEAIDREPNFLNGLRKTHKNINDELKSHFFKYFNEDMKSEDEYYYHIIDLNNIEDSNEFINAVFSNNNLSGGENLSIEVLCAELVIYVPMNAEVIQIVRGNWQMEQVFQGMDLKLSLGIRDTRGLYHESADQQKENEHLQDLLYNRSYDALMLVCPVFGDSNYAKLREDIKAVLKLYSKQTPIILLNNKVDLLIDDQHKKGELTDLFDLNSFTEPQIIEFDELKANINQRIAGIIQEFRDAQQKRGGGVLESVPCYLKPPSTARITPEMYKNYGPKQALNRILRILCDSLISTSEKIPFYLDYAVDEGKLPFSINRKKVRDIIGAAFMNQQFIRQVKNAALKNIDENLGKTPHGQGYNALGRKVAIGQGWSSNIDESYFINCKSFSITFPANVQNLITTALLDEIITNSITYTKGHFASQGDEDKVKEIIKLRTYRSSIFAANMLYDHAFKIADKAGFSYRIRFNQFLKLSRDFFKITDEDILQVTTDMQTLEVSNVFDSYTYAMVKELKHAVNLAFRLNVYIK
jgi:hypothetical protein